MTALHHSSSVRPRATPCRRHIAFGCVLLGLFCAPAHASPDVPDTATPDNAILGAVLTSGLRFIAPRTLEQHSIRDFTLWGLDGLSALDPALVVQEEPAAKETPARIALMMRQQVLGRFDEPAQDDIAGWTALTLKAMDAAWSVSNAVRSAGSGALLQSFYDELFNHLDPYSRYVAPSPAMQDRRARLGSGATVGLTLDHGPHGLIISAVNANGPAWAAGVNNGDRLMAVNGHATRGLSPSMVESWLDGDAETPVTLTIADGAGKVTTFSMRRAVVPPETVFAYHKDDMTILRVTAFSSQTAEEMSQYLDQMMQDHLTHGLILDLRGDRGGVLQQAVTAASLVLARGVAVVTQGRDPQANHVWAVRGGDMTDGMPVVVMVDGRTASAAEILAAALADHRRAVVIGSATLGKGLVQTIGQMPDDGELFVTWSRVVAPLGWPLQGLGVMPQLCTSRGATDVAHQLAELAEGRQPEAPTVRASRAMRYPASVSGILDIRRDCPAAIGTDGDLDAAIALLGNPTAYRAALTEIPDDVAEASP
ncbi:PDZ domain-containing protein [Acidomonas methanolica]|nr:PDZ domain-containing protein [Acidomonas methanolica]